MKTATILIQNAVRVLGVILIVLGFLFWTGHSFTLVPVHMDLGISLVGLLWILAIIGMVAKVNPVLTILAVLWGALVAIFGMKMGGWLPGPAHEAIRVLHFLIGLAAIALSEMLSVRIKRYFRQS
ncbi:MAG TPA: hypothetical protein VLI55_14495 [Bryobacteraceae bacterium]|nr:hypothetical protein [Bryobacteraceae bacterium]